MVFSLLDYHEKYKFRRCKKTHVYEIININHCFKLHIF